MLSRTLQNMSARGRQSYEASSFASSSAFSAQGQEKDVSQFVKYLLEGSGIHEDAVDFAQLRQELETIAHDIDETPDEILIDDNANESGASFHLKPRSPYVEKERDFRPVQMSSERSLVQDFQQSLTDIALQLDELKKEPAISTTHQTAMSKRLLESMSRQLEESGFAPLPIHLLTDDAEGQDLVGIAQTLFWSLQTVIKDYGYKGSLIEHLTDQVQSLLDTASTLGENYQILEAEHNNAKNKHTDRLAATNKHMAELQDTLTTAHAHEYSLEREYENGLLENKQLRARIKRIETLLTETQSQYQQMEERVVEMAEQDLRKNRRAENISKRALSGETRHVIAKDIRDVVATYEDRISALNSHIVQLQEEKMLREEDDARKASEHTHQHHHKEQEHIYHHSHEHIAKDHHHEEHEHHTKDQSHNMSHVLLDEVKELRDELTTVTQAFEEVQEEKYVLKLKLMALQCGTQTLNETSQRKNLDTKTLIRRDKEYYKLKLFKIDDMEESACRETIKKICVKLKIRNIDALVNALDDIAEAIRIIPQMQKFVFAVDSMVWSPPKVLEEFLQLDMNSSGTKALRPVRKLHETMVVIGKWRNIMDCEIKILRSFREQVCQLLKTPNVSDKSASDIAILNRCVSEIKRLINSENDNEFRTSTARSQDRKTLQHFSDLFAVSEREDVLPKMNSLYTFVTECNHWLSKIQHSFQTGSSDDVSFNKVLVDTTSPEPLFQEVNEKLGFSSTSSPKHVVIQ